MKNIKFFLITFAVVLMAGWSLSSCVKDLDVTPIDPSLTLPEDVLDSEEAFYQVLAKCYGALAVSGSEGPDADADIAGINSGFGQYMRALFNMNELTTDEASNCWNDQTIRDLHKQKWTTSDVFVTAMFSRVFYQISLCNEFIRRANASEFTGDNMQLYVAEARALRALSYYHAIDMFGNVPFATEENSVGSAGPAQIMRPDLYQWLVDEIIDFTPLLKAKGTNEYGRVDQAFAKMLLAKMYLNAEVYTDGAVSAWSECAAVCKEIIAMYPTLHPRWQEMFMADNHLCTDEIIFAVQSDPDNIKSYGNTTYIIKSSIIAGNADWTAAFGVGDGWGGLVVTPEFIDSFDDTDTRKMFFDGSPYTTDADTHTKEIIDDAQFKYGYCSQKFTNLLSDGTTPANIAFPSTDYPIFRAADAYLMLAECSLKGGASSSEGLDAYNAVRTRAGMPAVGSITLRDVLDERGRELYWENFRRSDLIRFGLYCGTEYLWSWKGGQYEGTSFDEHYELFPIPASEINANSQLVQNPGY